MLSRRTFIGSAAACAVAAGAAGRAERLRLREFAYSQVRLTEGPLAAMYRRMRAHYLKLDEDRPATLGEAFSIEAHLVRRDDGGVPFFASFRPLPEEVSV